MDLLIVSGLSGAGKSVAMNALEDIGFFCIDNIPAALLPSITAFSKAGDNQLKRVALCMDIRGCRTPEEIEEALSQLDAQGIEYEILFLDAPDDVLMRRYSETRRRHPMSISDGLSTREAFRSALFRALRKDCGLFTVTLLTRNYRVDFVSTDRPGGLGFIQHRVQIAVTARR